MSNNILLSKFSYIAFILLLALQTNTKEVNAGSVHMQDNFNDNYIETQWVVKNYILEQQGSNAFSGQLNVVENNQQLQIIGSDFIDDTYIDGNWLGWFGKSLISSDSFQVNNEVFLLDTDITFINVIEGYEANLTIEIDNNNRIIFGLADLSSGNIHGKPSSFLLFIEKGISRGIGAPDENENESGWLDLYFNIEIGKTYNLKLAYNPTTNITSGYIDNKLIHQGHYLGNVSDFHAGIAATVRENGDTIDARFDNFVLSTTDNLLTPTPTPSPTLTPLPSPTPTSIPNINILVIPDIKQFSNPWGSMEYDNATNWNPTNPTIARWGCALTSTSMILQYYGYSINPDSLNMWLNQNSGYTRNGGVLWPSIFKFTKLNTDGIKPLLEFSYHNPDNNFLTSEIESQKPSILKMLKPIANKPGIFNTHFILVKGINGTDYEVNDPASNSNVVNLLSQAEDKWGNYAKIGSFTPSHSDGSYMVLMIDDGFNLNVSDPSGSPINGSIKEDPIVAADNETINSGNSLNAFYLPKPDPGLYGVQISGIGNYQLDSYLFDINGNQEVNHINDVLTIDNNTKTYQILFSSNGSSYLYHAYFFGLVDLLSNYNGKNIYKVGVYNHIFNQITNSNNHLLEGDNRNAMKILNSLKTYIKLSKYLSIDATFANSIITEINIVIGQIKSL